MPSFLFMKEKPVETTLYAELIRRGLPADYAKRTAEELDDHRVDLLANLRAAGAANPEAVADERLGKTRVLAKRIARDYHRRSWFGRWPLVSFVVLPPLVLATAWTGVVLVLFGVGKIWTWSGGAPGEIWSPVEYTRLSWGLALGVFSFLVPAVVAWFYGRVVLQTTQSRMLVLTACLGIGLLNSLPRHSYRIDPAKPELAMNLISVPFCDPMDAASLRQLASPVAASQLLTPVLIGVILVWRDNSRRRTSLLAISDGSEPARVAA
ncbi:hypothetical protein Pla108_07530 [Botrimarina colliarenosi]|uniref:Uncharacterized protein n=1 Tax=Botrimarina colliarenosi TaxID=2528001 RepID=A0A5C6AK68_9BACT|nr:hypothetical protein [Botrimarina colliarenosi]TWT99810.1 hypothetical protein Pla108_07530 [Botrimarina colliarenosi]